ncbi:MAG: transglutaminase domain-containing protein [Candidatus Methanomethylicaceae archaeon]|jgi:transglutaminase-like putative cysteine protease
MILLPLFLLALASTGAVSGSSFTYNLTMTLVNGNDSFLPNSTNPYYCLLNQNVFPNSTSQTSIIQSVLFDGNPAIWVMDSDSDGNPVIRILTNQTLEPRENATVELSFSLYLQPVVIDLSGIGNISEIPSSIVEAFPLTGSYNLSQMPNASQLVATAQAIKGEDQNTLTVVFDMLQWFEGNMVYASNYPYPQNVSQTFSTLSGDCDDQANLFVTFCRIVGIPAYTTLGPIYLPGNDVETDSNMVFNLTNVGWHGWAMVYLPNNSSGEWVPVDLTFFSGAYNQDGHILSGNLFQHINSSAFAYWSTAEYLDIKNADYISDSVATRSVLINSSITWIESHDMVLVAQNVPILTQIYENLALILALFSLSSILFFTWDQLRRRSRDGSPHPAPS